MRTISLIRYTLRLISPSTLKLAGRPVLRAFDFVGPVLDSLDLWDLTKSAYQDVLPPCYAWVNELVQTLLDLW